MAVQGEKKRPAALNLVSPRPDTANSSTSDNFKGPRTPRFAEATSVHSPIEAGPTFADADPNPRDMPSDVGFGYIRDPQRDSIPAAPKSPLKSAMKVPGTPGRFLMNPLSPTFREEAMLEKQEQLTEKQQAKDLKVKLRVRMAKFALRGVHFSCSLIILAMLSSSFAIFNATKSLPSQSNMPAWAVGTNPWAQELVLAMACISLFMSILVMLAYCRGGHRRAEKVNWYYSIFAIGWFIVSLILWVLAAAVFSNSKNSGNAKDLWGWSCVQNQRHIVFADKVKYSLVCRLQNWTLICIVIEVVVEVISIMLYSIIFYRYYSKRQLTKSMDLRDRARTDLYLAQLRVQSAPNTPGFPKSPMGFGGPTTPGFPPKSPALSQYAMSPRHAPAGFGSLAHVDGGPANSTATTTFTPALHTIDEPQSHFAASPKPAFKLQAPPPKAPSATPKTMSPLTPVGPSLPLGMPSPMSPPQQQAQAQEQAREEAPHAPVFHSQEPVYDAVPIPGVYADAVIKNPPPVQNPFEN